MLKKELGTLFDDYMVGAYGTVDVSNWKGAISLSLGYEKSAFHVAPFGKLPANFGGPSPHWTH